MAPSSLLLSSTITNDLKKTNPYNQKLAEHLFRIEYGKIVSVVGRYLGISNIDFAEDIAQDTFYKAVTSWQHHGIPQNPEAWLYKVAKNLCFNFLKRENLGRNISNTLEAANAVQNFEISLDFSKNSIEDSQLRMMFACCHQSISPKSQIALMLQILCGFSIKEIASAFFSTYETINKRLLRAKRKLKNMELSIENISILENDFSTVLQTIYLLFNEGYSPTIKNSVIRKDLCFQSIRLCEILKDNEVIDVKDNCHALLSLMYLNVSRFDARNIKSEELVEMKNQDRSLWNRELINIGLDYLDKTLTSNTISKYHLIAAISANHCTASKFEETNWNNILSLYDSLLKIDNSPIVNLNRSVAISYAQNNLSAIQELKVLERQTDIDDHHLYHSTIAEFYVNEKKFGQAIKHLNLAITKADNERDIVVLKKKLDKLVPV